MSSSYPHCADMPCNGFAWENRRFADCMEKPADWMMNGWLRYGHASLPGNWECMRYYRDDDPGRFSTTVRYMKRGFTWDPSFAGGRRVHLYFFPMSSENTRHTLTLNGRAFEIGQWCALDVTDTLKQGTNELELELHGHFWNGRIFVSTQAPATYPYLGAARNRMWTLWNDWRRAAKERQCRTVFDATRESDNHWPQIRLFRSACLAMFDVLDEVPFAYGWSVADTWKAENRAAVADFSAPGVLVEIA